MQLVLTYLSLLPAGVAGTLQGLLEDEDAVVRQRSAHTLGFMACKCTIHSHVGPLYHLIMLASGSATLIVISACYCHPTEHALGRQTFPKLGMIRALAKSWSF